MELTKFGLDRVNALLDGIEQNATEGILGYMGKNGYLEIKTSVLELRQTLKTESNLNPDGGNAA